MAKSKITLIGFNNYTDGHIFDEMNLPEGIYKDTLIETILLQGGEFEVLYSDPAFMRDAIGSWSKKWYLTMEKWYQAITSDYNPIENYDRNEDWTDSGNYGKTTTHNESATGNDTSTSSGSGNTENKRSAYDSDFYNPHDNSSSSSNGSNTSNSSTTANGSGSENGSDSRTHKGRIHGNIGVTTSQQMIQSSLELYQFNLYSQIADLFIGEFCIYLY